MSGFSNFQTESVANSIYDSKFLYNTAVACVEYYDVAFETPYEKFIRCMFNCEEKETKNGIKWDDELINQEQINELMIDWHTEENA